MSGVLLYHDDLFGSCPRPSFFHVKSIFSGSLNMQALAEARLFKRSPAGATKPRAKTAVEIRAEKADLEAQMSKHHEDLTDVHKKIASRERSGAAPVHPS